MFVVAFDGVLRNALGAQIPEGVALYRVLGEASRVVIATDDTREKTYYWLRSNGLPLPADVVGPEVALPDTNLRVRQVEAVRGSGSRVEMVIDPDPDTTLAIQATGVAVLLFAHPTFARPTSRFSRAHARTWADIQANVQQRRLADLHSVERGVLDIEYEETQGV